MRINKELNAVVLIKFPHTGSAELDFLILQDHIRTLTGIKELRAGDLKSSHIKVTGFNGNLNLSTLIPDLGDPRQCRRRLDTGSRLKVIRRLKTSPTRIYSYKTFQDTAVNHSQFGENGFVPILGIIQKMLYSDEIVTRYDSLMMVSINALRAIPTVLLRFVVQVVWCEGLSRQNIAAMTLIAKYLNDGIRCPIHISQVCLFPQFRKSSGDIRCRIPIEVCSSSKNVSKRSPKRLAPWST